HNILFQPTEWIWADSAYPIHSWSVSLYKCPAANLADQNKKFNYWVSHMRVHIKSEHAVGYLKGWCLSLKGLQQQIDDETYHCCALEWVRTCSTIHTLVSKI
ncbi:hypothetical protein K439DRAFT_1349888, partial [Ramaria rubella]